MWAVCVQRGREEVAAETTRHPARRHLPHVYNYSKKRVRALEVHSSLQTKKKSPVCSGVRLSNKNLTNWTEHSEEREAQHKQEATTVVYTADKNRCIRLI